MKCKIQKKQRFIIEKLGNSNLESLAESFVVTKISKNGLSLITKNEENDLITKVQTIEIINFFKFVSLIFNNQYLECEKDSEYIKLFFEKFPLENSNLSNTNPQVFWLKF